MNDNEFKPTSIFVLCDHFRAGEVWELQVEYGHLDFTQQYYDRLRSTAPGGMMVMARPKSPKSVNQVIADLPCVFQPSDAIEIVDALWNEGYEIVRKEDQESELRRPAPPQHDKGKRTT